MTAAATRPDQLDLALTPAQRELQDGTHHEPQSHPVLVAVDCGVAAKRVRMRAHQDDDEIERSPEKVRGCACAGP